MFQRTAKKTGTRFYDYTMVFIIIFLCCFGLVMVFSASYYTASVKYNDSAYFLKRQACFMALGFVVMIIVSKIDYHIFQKRFMVMLAWVSTVALMFLTNYVGSFGREVNGKKRWFQISGHSLFQPSELVKIALIIVLAAFFVYVGSNIKKHFFKVAACWIFLVGIPGFLVASNNLSTGIIIVGICYIMFFFASDKKYMFILLFLAAVAVAAVMVLNVQTFADMGLLQQYQANRILSWLHPEEFSSTTAVQTVQGLYAIGNGGLFGKGLGNGIQKLGSVPEAQNDMIFSIICEELGVVGAVCILLVFFFLIYRLFKIARNAPDMFGFLLVSGIMVHISLQVVFNVAVVTGLMPNTGVTLPFFSYGGTAIVFLMTEMGLALSVSNRIVIDEKSGALIEPSKRRSKHPSYRDKRQAAQKARAEKAARQMRMEERSQKSSGSRHKRTDYGQGYAEDYYDPPYNNDGYYNDGHYNDGHYNDGHYNDGYHNDAYYNDGYDDYDYDNFGTHHRLPSESRRRSGHRNSGEKSSKKKSGKRKLFGRAKNGGTKRSERR